MSQSPNEVRQCIIADPTLSLPADTLIQESPLFASDYRSPRDRMPVFGVANIGSLLLRTAEGSEALGNLQDRCALYVGRREAFAREEADPQLPLYSLSEADRTQLQRLGIMQHEFPLIGFGIPAFAGIYGDRHSLVPKTGFAAVYPRHRLPVISDMDPESRRWLEGLWGVNLHYNNQRTLAPHVRVGDIVYLLPNTKASKVRTERTSTCPLSPRALAGLLRQCTA